MSKIILISNRLPVNIIQHEDTLRAKPSVGGLATGLSSYWKAKDSLWIGWPGLHKEELDRNEQAEVRKLLGDIHCLPVFLTQDQLRDFYEGFSNKTIWPLFHYFSRYTEYDERTWNVYQEVNEFYLRETCKVAEPNDTIWVHDYQLMLLPGMLREKLPNATIGFFLHIPFPSFEVFRLLPWRDEILHGILGADLIGFHTYDYVRHFLSSTRRLLGLDNTMSEISYENRLLKIDAYPMGIDYQKFNKAVERKKVQEEIERLRKQIGKRKVILSVDRLDYTKGIIQRLEAYDWYLTKHPEMREKVVMIMVAVPSRTNVDHYEDLRNQLEQLVGHINGELGCIGWVPIWYLFRGVPFERLVGLYHLSDVALITPLRDGMNLIAKEFVATKTNGKGVLILSEMAGAAQEFPEALIVNANDKQEIVQAIDQGMNMHTTEQKRRIKVMQDRLSRYTVTRWAHDFIHSLKEQKSRQEEFGAHRFSAAERKELIQEYQHSQRRLMFLDYDGTLVGFKARPQDAGPDAELLKLLTVLTADERNVVVVVSGRDRKTLDKWLSKTNASLIAEHGAWKKTPAGKWKAMIPRRQEWKEVIIPILETFTDRTPGSTIEEKNFSLVWHYRQVAPELAMIRTQELKDALVRLVSNMDLGVFEGNKILEIKNVAMHKGRAAQDWLAASSWEFVLAAGDDYTDEDLFSVMPSEAYSIKVGLGPSKARFSLNSVKQFRELLIELARYSDA